MTFLRNSINAFRRIMWGKKSSPYPQHFSPSRTEVVASPKVGDGESVLLVNPRQYTAAQDAFKNLQIFDSCLIGEPEPPAETGATATQEDPVVSNKGDAVRKGGGEKADEAVVAEKEAEGGD